MRWAEEDDHVPASRPASPLPDPRRDVIYAYRMKAAGSTRADMEHVLIDAAGRVRSRQVGHGFGDHADEIVHGLARIAGATAMPP